MLIKKILVISAHPDDETLGCGGTILKEIESGNSVYWCTFTTAFREDKDYIKKRDLMIDEVSKAYGFKKCFKLNFQASVLDSTPLKDLINALDKVIDEVKPDIIFTPTDNDVNSDHDFVYRTVLSCTKPSYRPFIEMILGYEIISSTNWSFPNKNNFKPIYFVDINKYLDKKIEIMKLFGEQLKNFPHPRSVEGIECLSKYRGCSAHLKNAEAFEVLRWIN